MSGWSASRITIFAARRVLPPDLIVPAEASAPRMKLTGPDAVPPPLSHSALERMCDRLVPAPDPPLKMIPSCAVPLEDRVHRVVDPEDEARRRLLRNPLDADVEPDRAVERRPLRDEHVLQLVGERGCLGVVGEVAALDPPAGDRVDHPVDDLAERRLALSAPSVPRKYFWATMLVAFCDQSAGNSTSAARRPPCRRAVGDASVATLPEHLVVRVDPLRGEQPADADAMRPGLERSVVSTSLASFPRGRCTRCCARGALAVSRPLPVVSCLRTTSV